PRLARQLLQTTQHPELAFQASNEVLNFFREVEDTLDPPERTHATTTARRRGSAFQEIPGRLDVHGRPDPRPRLEMQVVASRSAGRVDRPDLRTGLHLPPVPANDALQVSVNRVPAVTYDAHVAAIRSGQMLVALPPGHGSIYRRAQRGSEIQSR